jgi:hypothetical protein
MKPPRVIGIYLQLTGLRPSGYDVLRSVFAMAHRIPASGRDDGNFPQLRSGRNNDRTSGLGDDLGVRPGESDSTRMVCGVLLLTVATIIIVVALVWWLT